MDTAHNLSTGTPGNFFSTNESEICVFCHTPHNPEAAYPLWNHYSSQRSVSFLPYTSSNTIDFNKADLSGGLPSTSASRLCLACHEGTMALNNIANPSGLLGVQPTMGGGAFGQSIKAFWDGIGEPEGTRAWIGRDLTFMHPIGFDFSAHGDSEIVSLAEAKTAGLRFFGPGTKYMECPTCHDPHVDFDWIMGFPVPGDNAGDERYRPFLRKSNESSGLCLTCHQK